MTDVGNATCQRVWAQLLALACAPYRQAGRFAWHFAQGKLGRDPVFHAMFERGHLRGRTHMVDIGCGQGLLASLMLAAQAPEFQQDWPVHWHRLPTDMAYTGIDLMPKDIARAEVALRPIVAGVGARRVQLICADMRATPLPACDLVVILDVLHYVPHDDQVTVLREVAQALAPRGRLLLRVGDANQRRGFAISQWVDRTVTRIRGHRAAPIYGRALPDWIRLLETVGFAVRPEPMSQGTPFANVLLVADRPGGVQ